MQKSVQDNFYRNVMMFLLFSLIFLLAPSAFAITVGGAASKMTASIKGLAKLIGVGSYVAGLGFSIGAVMKFKQHKDNPTQIPVGTPIALVFIAAALIFLPTVMGSLGDTMFGTGGAKTAGTGGSWGFTTE